MIKAIETYYNGRKFRSRLEARWAVFLDALGVEYEYEPEGFVKDGVCYLPDFRVNCYGGSSGNKSYPLYLEVKGKADESDAQVLKTFTPWGKKDYCISDNPDWFPVLVLGDIPPVEDDNDVFRIPTTINIGHGIRTFDRETIDGRYEPAIPAADGFGRFFLMPNYIPDSEEWFYDEVLPDIADAYRIARQARFEHGEKPNKHKRDAFVFYRSFVDVVNMLKDESDKSELLWAIINYGLDDIEPKFTKPELKIAFLHCKISIDKTSERYQRKVDRQNK